jgi:hypothetical protein
MAVETYDRPGVPHVPWAPDSERETLERVAACVEAWERGLGSDAREQFTKRYQQYRGSASGGMSGRARGRATATASCTTRSASGARTCTSR